MDGVRFDIAIEANNLGVNTSAEQLVAFTNKIQYVNKVATEFDRVVAAARARLEESASAAKSAAAALQTAETRYKELESAANKAAKEVERAALAGKATDALRLAATAAAEKMREQADVVDKLRAKSDAAGAAQTRLAGALKTLESQQSAAAARIKAGIAKELDGAKSAIEKVSKEAETFGSKLSKSLKDITPKTKAVALGVVGLTAAIVAGGAKLLSFAGIKFDAITGALDDVKTMLTDGSSAAQGLKTIADVLFGPLLGDSAKVSAYVKEMFKGLVYGALLVVLAVLRLRNQILEAMSPQTRAQIKAVTDHIFSMEGAFQIGTAVAVGLVVALVILTAALVAFAIAELAALWPILLIIAAIAAIIAIFVYWDDIVQWFSEAWDDAITWLSDVWNDFVDGVIDGVTGLIDGIVDGITGGVGAVVSAMKKLATSGLKAFTDFFKISSPSKVMELQGTYIAEGTVAGIEDGSSDVDAAMQSMVGVPDGGGGGAKGTSPSAGSRTIHIAQLTVGDSPIAQKNWTDLRALLTDLFEGATLTIGGGEAPAT